MGSGQMAQPKLVSKCRTVFMFSESWLALADGTGKAKILCNYELKQYTDQEFWAYYIYT